MNVRIRRLRPDIPLPRYESDHAAAFDFTAADDVVVEPGTVALVPTGLVVEVPAGMFLGIFARSSTPLKRGLDGGQRRRRDRSRLLRAGRRNQDRGHELHRRAR